jgi:hypothetical protein
MQRYDLPRMKDRSTLLEDTPIIGDALGMISGNTTFHQTSGHGLMEIYRVICKKDFQNTE